MSSNSTNSVGNPLAQNFNVVVSIPETVKIKLVDASLLNEFEIWMYLSTVLLNIATGFWVSYVQNINELLEKILCWTAICFTLIFVFALIVAIYKRVKMSKKSKDVELSTSINNNTNI